MAQEKKLASVRWIAFIHGFFAYVSSVLLTLIVGIALSVALIPVFSTGIFGAVDIDGFLDSVAGSVLFGILGILLLWWATANSAKFVIRKYQPTDRNALLGASVLVFAILESVSIAVDLLLYGNIFVWEHLTSVIAVGVFYVVSKRYLLS